MSLNIIGLVDGLTELEKDTTGKKRLYSFNIPNGECIMATEERGYFIDRKSTRLNSSHL